MKVAVLAGGMGSRLSEETDLKPKPMVEIGGRPILWHILKHFGHHGFNDFVIALGYRGEVIKRWALELSLDGDLHVRVRGGERSTWVGQAAEDWSLSLVETGLRTQTGGRIAALRPHLGESTFMLTWGDGVCDLDLRQLLAFHRAHGRLVTMTVTRPPARFGHVELDGDIVSEFSEKPQSAEGWINAAFFVCEPAALDYVDGPMTHWEREPLERLAAERQLMAYRHESFWQCMDTLRDKRRLDALWDSGDPPWRVWDSA